MITAGAVQAGLRENEFFLEYMPTVSLADGLCVGAEALSRWRRPTGLVPPNQFIPLIEKTPVAGLFTYWVIETIAAELSEWLRGHPEFHLSFNVPPEILGRGGVAYAAERTGLLAFRSQLIVEVTERGLPDEMALEALEAAIQLGIRVAIDDVGLTGVNLAVFSRCPVNVIKLDRALVAELTPTCRSPGWMTSLTVMIRSAGLVVIAEGVETEDQVEILREAGIQMAQGYFFSQPLSVKDLMAYHSRAGRTGPEHGEHRDVSAG